MNGYKVIIDYCHNVDGMRRLTEFVDLLMAGDEPPGGDAVAPASRQGGDGVGRAREARATPSTARTGRAFGVIGIPGDRPNGDQREYGALAAGSFDRIYVREDRNLRGRKPGEIGGQRAGRGGLGDEGRQGAGPRSPSRCSTSWMPPAGRWPRRAPAT